MTFAAANAKLVLGVVAADLSDALAARFPAHLFRPRPLKIERVNTGGWATDLGRSPALNCYLSVWLDQFTHSGGHRLYAGFDTTTFARMQPLLDACPPQWRHQRTVTRKDLALTGTLRLRHPLDGDQFGQPILEQHGRTTFFGVYEKGDPAQPTTVNRFRRRAGMFLHDVIESAWAVQDKELHFPPQIERRVAVTHMVFERNAALAEACKRRDGYRCRVCELRFEDLYGELGEGFAEAHHVKPLAALDEDATTRLDDLVTVCANCHRMLHRMGEECWDWKSLRLRVRASEER